MTEVRLSTWGDVWVNRDEVIVQLYNIPPTESVTFHTMFEGISLKASGILQVIDQWVSSTNRNPDTIIINTPNQYEKINYKFVNRSKTPHFFNNRMLDYHRDYITINQQAKLFGLFLGRYTPQRNIIARSILTNYRKDFLLSIMTADRLGARDWWDAAVEAIGSLDNANINDQYNSEHNTNQSLLQFYNDFQIELAVETMTQGETFFPTEKTARPIMGSKPFITYASVDFLANLRDLGFRTFGKLWSEDYDHYEGIERWNRMLSVINGIIEQGYDCDLAQEIIQYNYNHLHEIMKV